MPALAFQTVLYLYLAKVIGTSATLYYSENYIYVDLARNWDQAEEYCQTSFGTHLASIHSQSTQNEVTELCKHRCWIGLNDKTHEGVWEWSDGTAVAVCMYTM